MMKNDRYELAPSDGWSCFSQHEQVHELISDSLSRVDDGGCWHHVSMSQGVEFWTLESTDECSDLYLAARVMPESASSIVQEIDRIQINVGDTDAADFSQLEKLVNELSVRFGIRKLPVSVGSA